MKVRFLLILALVSCKVPSQKSLNELSSAESFSGNWQDFRPSRPAKLEMCAAIRGNGNYIFAHWGQLAQALEHYGTFDAVAGGSSASATSFLYESMYLHPAAWACKAGTERCSEKQRAWRIAFLMKSLREFISVIGDRGDFGAAATAVPKLAERFKKGEYARAILAGDFTAAAYAAINILTSPEFSGIVDLRIAPRLKAAISSPSALRQEIKELKGAIASLDWNADDPGIVLRRGIVDFEQLAKRAGIAADFYAGRDPLSLEPMMKLLDSCTEKSVGKQWREIVKLPGPATLVQQPSSWVTPWIPGEMVRKDFTCGEYYQQILNQFFDRFNKAGAESTRLTDAVGGTIPAMISTSIFSAVEADNAIRSAYLRFLNGQDAPQLKVNSSYVRFGYWGTDTDLRTVQRNDRKFGDRKTRDFEAIGPAQWAEALRVSPQEPGLGSILCNYSAGSASTRGQWDTFSNLPEGTKCLRWSMGGWSDLYPTQVLKNLGCERVIYATRQDDEGTFVRGVAKLFTSGDADAEQFDKDLFQLDYQASSAAVGLQAASASLCSDWNMIQSHQIDCLGENAYESPIQSKDGFFSQLSGSGQRGGRLRAAGFVPFRQVTSTPPIRGCLPGAPLDAAQRSSPCK